MKSSPIDEIGKRRRAATRGQRSSTVGVPSAKRRRFVATRVSNQRNAALAVISIVPINPELGTYYVHLRLCTIKFHSLAYTTKSHYLLLRHRIIVVENR